MNLSRPFLTVCALVLPALIATSSSSARANSQPQTHDGFLFRLTLGLGYQGWSVSDGVGTQIELSGFGLSSSISLGGVVAENIAIHGDFFGLAAVSPNASVNGEDVGEATDSSISLTGLSAGATYWVMPLNLYLSASLGLAKASIEVEGDDTSADWGFGVRAMIGKEWWVADEWGIGLMAELTWANVPVESEDASSSYLGFNVGASLTFN